MVDRKKIGERNREKFDILRKFDLPITEYAITASGPIGIRNLREIQDIDLIVTGKLWDHLVAKYGMTNINHIKKVLLPGGLIEVFCEESFGSDKHFPSVAQRIARAEIIEGLPFESLDDLIAFKRRLGREKDLADLVLLTQHLNK